MSTDRLNEILDTLHKRNDYKVIRNKVKSIIVPYFAFNNDDDLSVYYSLDDKLNEFYKGEAISIRLLYGVLHEVLLEIRNDPNCNEKLYNFLLDHIDFMQLHLPPE